MKLLPANYKHSRQKQKQSTLSRIRHNKSKLLTAKTNRSRQQQIAHGKNKSLTAKAKTVVSGFWSAVVQVHGVTRHDLHDLLDVFPLSSETFLSVLKSSCFAQNADLASRKATISAPVVGKVSSPIFIIIFWGYPLVYSEKYSVIFMSPTCFACAFFNLLLLGGLCCSCLVASRYINNEMKYNNTSFFISIVVLIFPFVLNHFMEYS